MITKKLLNYWLNKNHVMVAPSVTKAHTANNVKTLPTIQKKTEIWKWKIY